MRGAISAARKVGNMRTRHATFRRLATAAADTVQITTLPNKLRVVTDNTPGHFASLGVYIDAGSRYEAPKFSGSSHVLDRLAFKSTQNRTDLDMSRDMDSLGGQMMCSCSRETMMYQSSHVASSSPLAMSLLSDSIRRPLLLDEEVNAQKEAAAYEIREVNAKPEAILPEILHEVAYQGNTLGNPLLCPEDRLQYITPSLLHDHLKTWYKPERMVIAGAGVSHDDLVRLADEHFGDMLSADNLESKAAQNNASSSQSHSNPKPSPSMLTKSLSTAASFLLNPTARKGEMTYGELASAKSKYTGGHLYIPQSDQELNHVYLAFEGVSIHDDDIYPLATIQLLLGGGGSFSAGGPGKGMYSRLYTQVLNHHAAIDHCSAFHHIYSDSSLFGLVGSAFPNLPTSSLLPILARQLSKLVYYPVPERELQRAKNQLMSSLIMALESRAVEVEDLGRQVLVHGRRVPMEEMAQKIEQITSRDINRIAHRIFGQASPSKPTLLVTGQEEIRNWKEILEKEGVGSLLQL